MNTSLFDSQKIKEIGTHLIARKETVAVAESVTAGLLQFALSQGEHAMQFFQGGITAYNLGQKSRHLFIEPIHAMHCHCVSEQVAAEMALNVCTLFKSHWGIGVTGYASPVPESDQKTFCYCAIAHNGNIVYSEHLESNHYDAYQVQRKYVETVLVNFAAVSSPG